MANYSGAIPKKVARGSRNKPTIIGKIAKREIKKTFIIAYTQKYGLRIERLSNSALGSDRFPNSYRINKMRRRG